MPIALKTAMQRVLEGWIEDLDPSWRALFADVQLGFDAVDAELSLEEWEPIFPTRRSKLFPGAPPGAHMLRAFDDIAPDQVRCIILGQDPYPEPGFATGRAFEAGNLATWRELDKMFSKSVRAFLQLAVAARSGDASFARSFADWPATLKALEAGEAGFRAPADLVPRWLEQGVLPLNASLTLTRFSVTVDRHQSAGHLPLWRPLILAALTRLAARPRPLCIIAFGDAAVSALAASGVEHSGHVFAIRRQHPASADAVLALPNPLVLCNEFLRAQAHETIDW